MSQAALITGGAQRIGSMLARHLAQNGYDIALHYHQSKSAAVALAQEIEATGQSCRLYPADLSDWSSTAGTELVDRVMTDFPELSVVINNASIYPAATLAETTPELLAQNFALHFRSPFLIIQRFAEQVKSGVVINLLDAQITGARTDHAAYLLSKKALADLTRMAAREYAPRLRVCGICPGPILPPPGQDEAYLTARGQALPLQRAGQESHILLALDYLLTNDFVTGELLFVDGGDHLL